MLLARVAGENVAAAVEACRHGAATARADLREIGGGLPPEAVDALLAMYEREVLRLERAARGVELVQRALAGQRFIPKL